MRIAYADAPENPLMAGLKQGTGRAGQQVLKLWWETPSSAQLIIDLGVYTVSARYAYNACSELFCVQADCGMILSSYVDRIYCNILSARTNRKDRTRLDTHFCFFSAGLRICSRTVRDETVDCRVSRRTYLERAEQAFIHAHHGPSIVEFTTIVWRTEQSDELSLREELITILHNLMRAAYQIHIVFL